MAIEKAILSLDRRETRTIFSKTPTNYLSLSPKTSTSAHSFQLITKTYPVSLGWSDGQLGANLLQMVIPGSRPIPRIQYRFLILEMDSLFLLIYRFLISTASHTQINSTTSLGCQSVGILTKEITTGTQPAKEKIKPVTPSVFFVVYLLVHL